MLAKSKKHEYKLPIQSGNGAKADNFEKQPLCAARRITGPNHLGASAEQPKGLFQLRFILNNVGARPEKSPLAKQDFKTASSITPQCENPLLPGGSWRRCPSLPQLLPQLLPLLLLVFAVASAFAACPCPSLLPLLRRCCESQSLLLPLAAANLAPVVARHCCCRCPSLPPSLHVAAPRFSLLPPLLLSALPVAASMAATIS